MENLQAQKEEIIALQSIFDEKDFIVAQNNPFRGSYSANVQLPPCFSVICNDPNNIEKKFLKLNVEYLPPITLRFELPNSYPSDTGPAFLLCCNWITIKQMSKLCRKFDNILKENPGEVILFQWIYFLQNDVLSFLDIPGELDISELCSYKINCALQVRNKSFQDNLAANKQCQLDTLAKSKELSITGGTGNLDCRALIDLVDGHSLFPVLEYFDKCKKQQVYETTLFTCDVCCSTQLGLKFSTFNECGHRFCQDCLKSYFEVQITEGNVHQLNCPAFDCKTQADGSQVKQLVSKQLYEKYDSLLLSRTLENMRDVVFCPRKVCQAPLIIENESMGWCNKCSFVFCIFCRMTHHGVAPCRMKWEEQKDICNSYMAASFDEKASMEKRYGKKALKFLVENTLSEDWMSSFSKKCPECQACIEKFEGCNKMACYKCGTYFCWLCMAKLPQTNPYHHFSNPRVPCFNKLFPDEEIEENEVLDDTEPGEFLEYY